MKKLVFFAFAAGTLLTLGTSNFKKKPITPGAVYAYDPGNDTTPKKHKPKKDTSKRGTAGITFAITSQYAMNK